MEGQPFFTTIAGLGVSFAGFGAVIANLRNDPSDWDPVNLWRFKTIIRHALIVAFLGLALVPIHTFTQDDVATVRIGSALTVLWTVVDLWRLRRPDPRVWDRASLLVYWTVSGFLGLLALSNTFLGMLGLLQVVFLAGLSSPAGVFSNFVRELGPSVQDDPGSEELPPA